MLRFSDHFERFHVGRLVALAAFAIFVTGYFELAQAQQPGQMTFPSSEEAYAALLSAAQREDQQALLKILGATAKEIVSVGDEDEDRTSRRQFVEKYREMHRLVREPDGTIALYVGAENWPLPIPLRHKANRWYFDPVASKAEILFRRIGRNELETIQLCRDSMVFVLAVYQFGRSLPLAKTEDHAKETIEPRPLSGYHYRILKRQGKHAPGGAKNYLVNGRMTGGFAFVAYPAEYRSSGVMTFIVNRDGVVYQKDLGPRTAIRARALTRYDPDTTWKKVE